MSNSWQLILNLTLYSNTLVQKVVSYTQRNLNLIQSNRNQSVFTIFRLILIQTAVCLVPNQSEKVNEILFRFDLIRFGKYFSVCRELNVLFPFNAIYDCTYNFPFVFRQQFWLAGLQILSFFKYHVEMCQSSRIAMSRLNVSFFHYGIILKLGKRKKYINVYILNLCWISLINITVYCIYVFIYIYIIPSINARHLMIECEIFHQNN